MSGTSSPFRENPDRTGREADPFLVPFTDHNSIKRSSSRPLPFSNSNTASPIHGGFHGGHKLSPSLELRSEIHRLQFELSSLRDESEVEKVGHEKAIRDLEQKVKNEGQRGDVRVKHDCNIHDRNWKRTAASCTIRTINLLRSWRH